MRATWKTTTPDRPNPYLDWEHATRPKLSLQRPANESWCSAQIELIPSGDNGYRSSLERLDVVAQAGKLSGENDQGRQFTLRMAEDELGHLTAVKKDLGLRPPDAPVDPREVRFFIYRPESFLYDGQGKYATADFYKIIDIGPPIPDLKFNANRQGGEPTSFDKSPLADFKGHVAIGIIDDGIAFAHERFRIGKDKTRIQAIWFQESERRQPDNGVAFGRRLDKRQIECLLKSGKSEAEIYLEQGLIDFSVGVTSLASRASHGTSVLDLASGFDPAKDKEREKFRRPIFAVQLPPTATADTSGTTLGSYVLQAVRQIMVWVDAYDSRIPLIINFSYGIQAGPKDGTHRLERALDDLIGLRNERAPSYVVLPAGNSYRSRAVAEKTLADRQSLDLDWVILPDDGTPNFLEIWLDGSGLDEPACPVQLTLTPPTEQPASLHGLQTGDKRVLEIDGSPIAAAYYDAVGTGALARGRIMIAVGATVSQDAAFAAAPSGRWRLSLTNASGRPVTAHCHVQRDDTPFGYRQRGRQSYLDHPLAYCRDPETGDYHAFAPDCPLTSKGTLSAIATGNSPIVVGAAADSSQSTAPAKYTSSGPTKSRPGPDCSAVVEEGAEQLGVLAAGTYSGTWTTLRGTSLAAPLVVRKLAGCIEDPGFAIAGLGGDDDDDVVHAAGNTRADHLQCLAVGGEPQTDDRRLGRFVLSRSGNRPKLRRFYTRKTP